MVDFLVIVEMVSHVDFVGLVAEDFEHVNLRRPAQRLGQEPERRPHPFALGRPAADFEPAVLLAELAVGRHHA